MVWGGVALSKRIDGPAEPEPPENMEERRGRATTRRSGRRPRSVDCKEGGGSGGAFGSLGLLRGLAPPN